MDIAGFWVEPRRATAEIDVVYHRCAETYQFLIKEDRRKKKNIWQVLATVVGIIINEEVVGTDFIEVVKFKARPKRVRN